MTGKKVTATVTAVQPMEKVLAGSIDETTEHGTITVQFNTTPPLPSQ